jgi:hypothetical protein
MTTLRTKSLLSLLAGLYLLGCQAAVLHLASSWGTGGTELVVNSLHKGPAKTFPHLSWPQRRSHLPLVAAFTFVSPPTAHAIEYTVEAVDIPLPRDHRTPVYHQVYVFSASDSSPPSLQAA